ncbi:gephyrin-like molybdotransferase Glp [Luteimicrobium subarcticum]|uniref:Molybdopterin molybdenumtransferase n=1 Tax=Luteimicrobium subarcticum TaxID=620910 RepID=A0A2M8W1B9_9MICO|nr:gephyrin-like molybdotransferase Glp [Luteimicrobium subarcticum]PJI84731.1 molybdopterin molybdotransferase [Luteimicrobium subarcticum]
MTPRSPAAPSGSPAASALVVTIDDAGRDVRLDVTVAAGRTLAVVGPNGAGKSTLLQTVAGLYVPPVARVAVGERALTDTATGVLVPAHRRAVGLLEQRPVLFGHLTCTGNVAFGPRSAGTSRRTARTEAHHWLDVVGAGTLARRRPGSLSGGQAQRVALARALAAAPDVVLLDEPFVAVDQPSVPRLRRVVADVLRGLTAVVVTHDLDDVLALADDVVVIERGRAVDQGPVRAVLGARHSAFLAGMPWLDVADPHDPPHRPRHGAATTPDRAPGTIVDVTDSHAPGPQPSAARPAHEQEDEQEHVDRPRTVADHADRVAALVEPALATRGDEVVAVADLLTGAHGSPVLARDAVAALPSPVFENSQMDGYALRAADVAGATPDRPVALRVVDPVPAGTVPAPLEPDTAAPIMTGAPVPAGADVVLRVEDADPARFVDPGSVVRVRDPLAPGTYVRPTGSDLAAGDVVVRAGERLGPARLGALVAAGVAEVAVRRAPHVLLVSTGSELAPAGASLGPAQVPDVNGAALAAALREVGARVTTAVVPDDDDALARALADVPADVDVVVTSGGVSAGAYEVVRQTLGAGDVWFGHVAMQPGGPQGAGTVRVAADAEGTAVPVVAFPGNPVSALVSFETFLRPVLARAAGLVPAERRRWTATLAEPLDSPPHLHQVRRGALDADGRVVLVGGPGSHLVARYAAATLLVQVPVGVRRLEAGDEVEVWEIA